LDLLRCFDNLHDTGTGNTSFLLFKAWKGSTIIRFKFLETVMTGEDLLMLEVAIVGQGMQDLICDLDGGNSVGTRLGFFRHEDLTSRGHGLGILELIRCNGPNSALKNGDLAPGAWTRTVSDWI
jgi:hypothetical protein